jgi:hypothetical protein
MTIQTIKVYSIDEHPNKEAVFDFVRHNWHWLADHAVSDFIDSLKALADHIGAKTLDYSVSALPDRGEFITLDDYYIGKLNSLKADDLPLTGCYYDAPIIEAAQQALKDGNGRDISGALKALHDEADYIYSDEGLNEFLSANDHLFLPDGGYYA